MRLDLRANAVMCPSLETYHRLQRIPGFFNKDDALHFALMLGYQAVAGIEGDVLEIGSWFGRSTAFIAYYIGDHGRLLVCDAFQLESTDQYDNRPSIEQFRSNLLQHAPAFDIARLDIYPCLSADLKLPKDTRLRFAHVDGGHGFDEALHDLRLVADFVAQGGVVVVDDYAHPRWPDVHKAVDAFLGEHENFGLAATLNRWQATGQKAYLVRKF